MNIKSILNKLSGTKIYLEDLSSQGMMVDYLNVLKLNGATNLPRDEDISIRFFYITDDLEVTADNSSDRFANETENYKQIFLSDVLNVIDELNEQEAKVQNVCTKHFNALDIKVGYLLKIDGVRAGVYKCHNIKKHPYDNGVIEYIETYRESNIVAINIDPYGYASSPYDDRVIVGEVIAVYMPPSPKARSFSIGTEIWNKNNRCMCQQCLNERCNINI